MLGQIQKLLFDMPFLGVDAFEYPALIRVGQMHERGEAFSKADWIDDGQRSLAGRDGGHESEYVAASRRQSLVPMVVLVFEHDRHVVRQLSRQWERGSVRSVPFEIRHFDD